MRPGQSNKRSRGRGRKGPSPLSRSYESNGPDVKIRGTAQHIADKYINLARDAQSSGDTVLSEAYLQHAEHFYRIVAAAQQQMNQPVNVKRADDPIDTDDSDDRDGFDPSDPDAPQPETHAGANGAGRDRNERGDRGHRGDDGEDGDRRGRRGRGRPRRGRGDELRSDDHRGDDARAGDARSDDTGSDQERVARDVPTEPRPVAAETSADEMPKDNEAAAEPSADGEAQPAPKTRRAPRRRKADVEVADRFDGDERKSAASNDEDVPPKPVSFGEDVSPVQAAADD